MHTEHLQNVRVVTILTAWFIAVAVTSLIIIALVGLNVIDAESTAATRAGLAAAALGFFAGGAFAGARAGLAPILHGIFIGLTSLVVWFVLNFVLSLAFDWLGWEALTPALTVSVMLVQIVSAVLGARVGYRFALRGQA